MELPQNLREMTENEARKYPLKKLAAAAEKLSSGYRENSGTGSIDALSALAYACARLPATYAAVTVALQKTSELFGGEIHTLLDAGAGCGAVSLAAAEVFPELERVVCIEREPEMINIGEKLMRDGFPCGYEWRRETLEKAVFPKADLVTASYVMNELLAQAHANTRAELTEKLWQAAKKLLVIIEPGTPAGFKNIIEIRETLLSLGAKILAPCPDIKSCPLPENDWCHFTARVARTRLHKALKGGEAPYEDEKFSFIAAVRGDEAPCAARVIRHPKIESGKITLKLCTGAGITEKTVTKKDGADFKKARKSDSGDSFCS